MNLEHHDDCNIVSKGTAAKEHVIWMLYLDQVDWNAVFKNRRLKNRFFLSMREVRFKSVLYE